MLTFFFDDFPFVVQALLGNVQIVHAVRFKPQSHGKVGAWHGLPVDRRIGCGVGIVDSAYSHDIVGEMLADCFGAVEHQVFKKVGKASLAGLLISRANVIPHFETDDRRLAALDHHGVQAVRQIKGMDIDGWKTDGSEERVWREQDQQGKESQKPAKNSCKMTFQSASMKGPRQDLMT